MARMCTPPYLIPDPDVLLPCALPVPPSLFLCASLLLSACWLQGAKEVTGGACGYGPLSVAMHPNLDLTASGVAQSKAPWSKKPLKGCGTCLEVKCSDAVSHMADGCMAELGALFWLLNSAWLHAAVVQPPRNYLGLKPPLFKRDRIQRRSRSKQPTDAQVVQPAEGQALSDATSDVV